MAGPPAWTRLTWPGPWARDKPRGPWEWARPGPGRRGSRSRLGEWRIRRRSRTRPRRGGSRGPGDAAPLCAGPGPGPGGGGGGAPGRRRAGGLPAGGGGRRRLLGGTAGLGLAACRGRGCAGRRLTPWSPAPGGGHAPQVRTPCGGGDARESSGRSRRAEGSCGPGARARGAGVSAAPGALSALPPSGRCQRAAGLHGPPGQSVKPARPPRPRGGRPPARLPGRPPCPRPCAADLWTPGDALPSRAAGMPTGCSGPSPSPSPGWRQLLLTPFQLPRTKFKFQSLRLVTHGPGLRTAPSQRPFSSQKSPPAGKPLLPRDPSPGPNAAPAGALPLADPRSPRRDPLPCSGAPPQHRTADVSARRHFPGHPSCGCSCHAASPHLSEGLRRPLGSAPPRGPALSGVTPRQVPPSGS